MSGFPLDSFAIFKNYERKSLIMPDRRSETVQAWLEKHPEVEIVSRDRASGYAKVRIVDKIRRFRRSVSPQLTLNKKAVSP